jgi:L-2-hydroxyglutarate oxidase LhgO
MLSMTPDAHDIDVAVIGAGVIGLAVARALALAGREVTVLEAESHIAEHQSSRNSEVIHAGLYYAPGSAKARFCLAGKRELYAYAAARGFDARPIGKLVVATSEAQIAKLEAIRANAAACGMDDLDLIDGAAARRMEPALRAAAALWSPTSGVVDSHAYMLALMGEAEAHGASFVFRAPVERAAVEADGVRLFVGGDAACELVCRTFVNCGGLFAPALARATEGFPREHVPQESFARGNYFGFSGRAPFSRLIYPLPEPGGLGVHLTLDLGGQARFGPDVEWIERVDYTVNPARQESFYGAIRAYWPGLPDGSLAPTYAGVRAKIGPRERTQDFVISGPNDHGLANVVALFGVESPGLTASLAIGAEVARRVREG